MREGSHFVLVLPMQDIYNAAGVAGHVAAA
jgi:hypothetical protein